MFGIYATFALLLFGFCIIYLVGNWSWVSKEPIYIAAIFSGITAIFGAMVGGLLSYLGGVNSAQKNYDLNEKQQKRQSQRELIMQLDFSYDLIYNNTSAGTISVDGFIYDSDWSRHLAILDFLPEERNTIIRWFHQLKYFNMIAANSTSLEKEIKASECISLLASRGFDEKIKAIITKYSI